MWTKFSSRFSQHLSYFNIWYNVCLLYTSYRFEDMMYDELRQCLPGDFDMLLISSPARWGGQCPDRVICLPMPLKAVSYTHLQSAKEQGHGDGQLDIGNDR